MQPLRKTDIAAQAPKARIVQHNKRRFSIRLEAIYWRSLEQLARRNSLRLGQFIAALADGYRGHNLSSYLRVVSMLEAERALAQATLAANGDSLLTVVQSCPCPGVLLSRARTIIACNDAFGEWLGVGNPSIAGAELTSLLQIRTGRSLNEVWSELMVGRVPLAQANVLLVTPGRANAAQAKLVPLCAGNGGQVYAVMWLTAKGDKPPADKAAAGTEIGKQGES